MARTVLTNVNLLDGLNPAVSGATVVVDGERIAAVHGHDEVVTPAADDVVVDAGGRTVIPGMATCHFHSTYLDLGSRATPYGYDHPPAIQALIAARNLKAALASGFTTAVSAGASHDIDPAMATAIATGMIPGPRFVPGSRELSTTGHANDNTPPHWNLQSTAAMRLCDGPDEFRKGVRTEVRAGARVIKLFVTGGHLTTVDKHRTEMTRDELAAAIETAHERDVLIRGHITNKAAIMMAIELGVDIVDHCDDIDDEVIAALAETGTFMVPSVRLPEVVLEQHGAWMGPDAVAAMRDDLARMYELLLKADAAGVRILVGDDYGAAGLPHGAYSGELASYVTNAGMSPLDVLRWAAPNGAALVGREHELGTIAPGKLADLVVLDADPSVDVTVLGDATHVVAVLIGGATVSGALV